MKMIQLYDKALPTKIIDTRWGKMDYYNYLVKEKIELESLGRTVELKREEKRKRSSKYPYTEVYLMVNNIA